MLDIEMDVLPVLEEAEWLGIEIDLDVLDKLQPFYTEKVLEAETTLWNAINTERPVVDREINLGSPLDVSWLLFEHMGLQPPKVGGKIPLTETGYISTNRKLVLEQMEFNPVVDALITYRIYQKLLQFVVAYRNAVHPLTRRIHTAFNLIQTDSDRLSSGGGVSKVNLQQVPSRLADAKKLRSAFRTTKDGRRRVIVKADESQHELRVCAAITKDPVMVKVYNEDGDIHDETNWRIFGPDGLNPKENFATDISVRDSWRKISKNGNFGNLYRFEASTASNTLQIPKVEAQKFITNLRNLYAGVETYHNDYVKLMHIQGYSESIFGYRRPLPNLSSTISRFIKEAERQGWNLLIQSSCSQMMKITMIRIWNALHDLSLESRILLQIHDELVLDAVVEELELVYNIVNWAFTDFPIVTDVVPLKAGIEIGRNWLEVEEVDANNIMEVASRVLDDSYSFDSKTGKYKKV